MLSKIEQIKDKIENLLKSGANRSQVQELIRSTGLKETQARFWTRHFCGPNKTEDGIRIEQGASENTIQYTGDTLINVENLLQKCNVDKSKWDVTKFVLEEKHIAKKTEDGIEFHPKYDIRAWLQKKTCSQEDVLKDFIEKASLHSPKTFAKSVLIPTKEPKEFLFEISIFDSHLAKLVWHKECGGVDYDLKIATDLYRKALEDLIGKAPIGKIDRIVFPVGNDFFNSDNELYTTTAGTPQHDDSRWQKSFSVGCELLVESIEKLSTIAVVDVIIVPGNHDRQKVFYLGEYLNAWFKNNKLVNIDNSPNLRKYYRYHKSLLGFSHGNQEKHVDLPLIMARESKENWSACDHYYWHIGHFHHETVKDYKGVVVSALPSICPADSWHHGKGYVKNLRGAQAFLYHKEDGLTATFLHTVKD